MIFETDSFCSKTFCLKNNITTITRLQGFLKFLSEIVNSTFGRLILPDILSFFMLSFIPLSDLFS